MENQNDTKVTAEQVELWIGSETTRSDIMELLAELANGDYDPQDFKENIIDLWEITHN